MITSISLDNSIIARLLNKWFLGYLFSRYLRILTLMLISIVKIVSPKSKRSNLLGKSKTTISWMLLKTKISEPKTTSILILILTSSVKKTQQYSSSKRRKIGWPISMMMELLMLMFRTSTNSKLISTLTLILMLMVFRIKTNWVSKIFITLTD